MKSLSNLLFNCGHLWMAPTDMMTLCEPCDVNDVVTVSTSNTVNMITEMAIKCASCSLWLHGCYNCLSLSLNICGEEEEEGVAVAALTSSYCCEPFKNVFNHFIDLDNGIARRSGCNHKPVAATTTPTTTKSHDSYCCSCCCVEMKVKISQQLSSHFHV